MLGVDMSRLDSGMRPRSGLGIYLPLQTSAKSRFKLEGVHTTTHCSSTGAISPPSLHVLVNWWLGIIRAASVNTHMFELGALQNYKILFSLILHHLF